MRKGITKFPFYQSHFSLSALIDYNENPANQSNLPHIGHVYIHDDSETLEAALDAVTDFWGFNEEVDVIFSDKKIKKTFSKGHKEYSFYVFLYK